MSHSKKTPGVAAPGVFFCAHQMHISSFVCIIIIPYKFRFVKHQQRKNTTNCAYNIDNVISIFKRYISNGILNMV